MRDEDEGFGNYFARIFSRWRMIPASARNELFTVSLLGKTLATSDSRTTTFAPCANRRAYLPRTPREKSYSARIGEPADLLARFFMRLSFSSAGASGADDADIITAFGVERQPAIF